MAEVFETALEFRTGSGLKDFFQEFSFQTPNLNHLNHSTLREVHFILYKLFSYLHPFYEIFNVEFK